MKEKIKNQIGFIQIPILIAIIVGVLIIGGGGYFGIKEYKNYQAQKLEEERQSKESQQMIALQEGEIEKLKEEERKRKEAEDLQEKLKNYKPLSYNPLSGQKDQKSQSPTPQATVLPQNNNQYSVSDLAKFIVRIICSDGASPDPNESRIVSGSGTIFGLNRFIITNSHVVEDAVLCSIGITDDIKKPPSTWYEATPASSVQGADISLLRPSVALPTTLSTIAYNLCAPEEIELGDEIIVLGYPVVGGNTITATEGVVSGFEGFMVKTSAKIEHGNSGGGAFLKKNGCWFGIPTSVAQGELESLGYIINYSLIHEKANE